MAIAFGILFVLLHKMTFGRKTFAIGGNENASYIAGIKSDRVKYTVYAISGMMSALAGLILTSRLNSAQPTADIIPEMSQIYSIY